MSAFLRILGSSSLFLALGALVAVLVATPQVAEAPLPQIEDSRQGTGEPSVNTESSFERNDKYYQVILDRPVFEITRRPIEPRVEAPLPEPEPEPEIAVVDPQPTPALNLPEVSLLGVMSTGSRIRALISVDNGELVWLTEGEKIGGWTITGAGEDWLELAADDNKVRLELFE